MGLVEDPPNWRPQEPGPKTSDEIGKKPEVAELPSGIPLFYDDPELGVQDPDVPDEGISNDYG
jgi:hypothetical protein